MHRRARLIIAYLGTPFSGWQRQPGQVTVQGEIEAALARMTKSAKVAIVGAGRTDAGVHASGQAAHVDLAESIPVDVLPRTLNATLPEAIRVRSARAVDPSFHARKSARAKHYVYRCRWRAPALPWQDLRSSHLKEINDEASFRHAMNLLGGVRDMASFTVPAAAQESTVRALYRVWALRRRHGLDLHFVGQGFLRYQVRRMVGALLEVGWRRRDLASFRSLLEHPQPGSCILTAPARGLTLERVHYRSIPTPPEAEVATLLW